MPKTTKKSAGTAVVFQAPPGRPTDAVEFAALAQKWAQSVTRSPQAAKNALADLGITTRTGKLTKRYG